MSTVSKPSSTIGVPPRSPLRKLPLGSACGKPVFRWFNYELGNGRVHCCWHCCGRRAPPLAFLVVAKVLPAMQESAAQVEPLGLEGGLDLPPLRLSDQAVGCWVLLPACFARSSAEQ